MKRQHLSALQQFSADITEIAARCRPAVVTIYAEAPGGASSGSGFLIDAAGNVITNNHVVEGCGSDLKIQFATGLAQPATLVSADPLTDLAVIHTSGPLPTPCRCGLTGQFLAKSAWPWAVR